MKTTTTTQESNVSRTVRLVSPGRIAINQDGQRTAYLFARIESQIGGQGFRLFKIGRDVGPGGVVSLARTEQYSVLIHGRLSTCDCKDGTYRGHKRPCKHVAALQALQAAGQLS